MKFTEQEHRELAREAVRKSLVLLKNGKYSTAKPFLPLPKKAPKILIAGSHADNLGYQCGGWTITWQGLGGNDLTTGMFLLLLIGTERLCCKPRNSSNYLRFPNGLLEGIN
jgi:beta-glucosidase-like glycosyl hydrolase